MTYSGVLNAVEGFISSQLMPVPIKTVGQVETMQPSVDPTQCPACLILEVPGRRKPLAGQPGGWIQRDWDIECHLFAYYGDLAAGDADGFRSMVDQLEAIFGRTHYNLSGVADIQPTDFLLKAGLESRSVIYPWQEESGMILRRGYVSAHISEILANA